MNSIRIIHPYWDSGSLVFDDAAVGLQREPFVAGADTALMLLSKRVAGCEERFTMLFSDIEFPGSQFRLDWTGYDQGGNWYFCPDVGVAGWLCPALYKYFDAAPTTIWIEIRSTAKGGTQ